MTIKLTVNPRVVAALTQAFPSSNAQRALDKYVSVLEELLFAALQFGQTPEQRKLKLYSISTKRLRDEGGQIGPNKVRVHKWLDDNGFALVANVVAGSNISGKLSQVKLSALVTMEDTLLIDDKATQQWTDDEAIDAFLLGDDEANAALVAHLYPDIELFDSRSMLLAEYDLTPVDVESLKSYIDWLGTSATKINAAKKAHHIRQARIVLAVAQHTQGWFLQKKKPSAFGRIYYYGLSIQNVSKTLREAVLGDCWEYDIRSSVIAWKMGFAVQYAAQQSPIADVRQTFSATLSYLEDKPDFMATVRHYTFDEDSAANSELQMKLIKRALTAVSFGARNSSKGWIDSEGSWQNPAIVEIIKNADERQRFLSNPVVRAFIHEQKLLDDYIFNSVKLSPPELLKNPVIQTASSRPSKSKVIAYLYQHAEMAVMDLACAVATENGKTILARIHDAVIIKQRLGANLKHEIELRMREATGNPYWHLAAKELHRFNSRSRNALADEEAHRQRIAEEEKAARMRQ